MIHLVVSLGAAVATQVATATPAVSRLDEGGPSSPTVEQAADVSQAELDTVTKKAARTAPSAVGRVKLDAVTDKVALIAPLAVRPLLISTGGRVQGAGSYQAPNTPGIALDQEVTVLLTGRWSLVASVPWSAGSGTALDNPVPGNVGLLTRFLADRDRDQQWGFIADARLGTASAGARNAMLFAQDIPRWGPGAYTLSLGAFLQRQHGLSVVSLALGGDAGLTRRDPAPEAPRGAAWVEGAYAIPARARLGSGLWLAFSPMLEGVVHSAFSSDGAAAEGTVTVGASLALLGADRSDASDQTMWRVAMSFGFQAPVWDVGIARVDGEGRFLAALEVGFTRRPVAY